MENKSVIWHENINGSYKGICIQEKSEIANNCFMLDIGYKDEEKIKKLVNSENEILNLGFSEKEISYKNYEILKNNLEEKEKENTVYTEDKNNLPILRNKKELEEYIRNSSEIRRHYVYEKERFNVYTINNEHEKGIEVMTLDKMKNILFKNPENRSNYMKLAKLNNKIKWEKIENQNLEKSKTGKKRNKRKEKELER